MKKIYFFLSMLLLCIGATTAQAQSHKVMSIGEPLTDVSTLTAGQQVLLFCQGQIDPGHYEYQTRYGFVREQADNKLVLSRKLYDKKNPANPNLLGTSQTSPYLWTVETVIPAGDGSISVTLKNDSTGRYVSAFGGNNQQGQTGIAGDFLTIEPYTAAGDTIFSIGDANNIYFNGVNIDGQGGMGDPARLVGWNEKGQNSNYMIYVPTVETVQTYSVTFLMFDENEDQMDITVSVPVGESIEAAPEWEFHDYDAALTEEMFGEAIEFPFTPTEDMPEVGLMYSSWPLITIQYVNTEGTIIKEAINGQYKTGTVFEAPTIPGYVLETEEYATYTVGTESETITIVYRADATANLPFVPTTIADGQLSDNTVWYSISINGKSIALDTTTGSVNIATTESGDALLWAFTGDMTNGFKIYNKATGTEKILWADNPGDGTAIVAVAEEDASEPNTFDLISNDLGGYSFALHGNNAYMNNYGGGGVIKLWSGIDKNSNITFKEFSLPFQTSDIAGTEDEFPAETKWYMMQIRNTKYIYFDEGNNEIRQATNKNAGLALLWAFTGNTEDGFKIYNHEAGPGKILWGSNEDDESAQHSAVFLSMEDGRDIEAPNTFDYLINGDGFTLKLHGGLDNKYVNDISNRLGFWQTTAGASDVGSKINFIALTAEDVAELEKAAADAVRNAKLAKYRDYLNAENCVGGWTAEELADLKTAVESEDLDACAEAIDALPESSIEFDVEKKYVIISAAYNFLLNQPDKTYAIWGDGNAVVQWKELNTEDAGFVWSFETASDTTYYMKRYDKYLSSYRWGGSPALVEWAENPETDGSVAAGLPAPVQLLPALLDETPAAPAAFNFRLPQANASDEVWLSTASGTFEGTATSGNIGTYKMNGEQYGSVWRLKTIEDAGIDITGIGSVSAASDKGTNVIYDLSGRRVQQAVKGLYIVNGKKVLVK